MLGPGRYLLGVIELLLLVGLAWVGAARARRRWLPELGGEVGFLASAVLTFALLLWVAELLGTLSAFKPLPYLIAVAVAGLALRALAPPASDAPAPPASDAPAPPAGGTPMGAPRRAQAAKPPSTVGVIGVTGPAVEGQGPSASLEEQPSASPGRPSASAGRPSASAGRPSASAGRPSLAATVISLLIAGIAIGHFVAGVKFRLGTGMTGFDSTWYHGPFAAGFFQTGNTIDLHFIAPQFLAWFYPANGEVAHAIGMLAFSRDLLSPLLNLGWLLGCLLACWCVGRPFRVAPWSLALGAIALSVPALADQAGEARNDIVGIFFLLAAIAIALNAAAVPGGIRRPRRSAFRSANPPGGEAEAGGSPGSGVGGPGLPAGGGLSTGALLLVGLAVGLAAGTKLNFLLPAAVLVLGLTTFAPRGARWRALLCSGGMALAGGGYWYLRNLVHTGNPLPWIHHLGPLILPAPAQALGGREAHSVLSYLTDGSLWREWFLPGLHDGLWLIWPALAAAALAGLLLPLISGWWAEKSSISGLFGQSTFRVLAVSGLAGIAAVVAWLVSPTSASGPDGMPRGFESGLRYLAPALVLGLALLPTAPPLRALAARLASLGPKLGERPIPVGMATPGDGLHFPSHSKGKCRRPPSEVRLPRRWTRTLLAAMVVLTAIVGYPVQRHYLRNRYRDPSFTAPGLDAAFAWARDVSGARIATTSTRQYPLFGTDLSNRVAYLGIERPHGGFEAASDCRQFRRLVDEGDYDYIVATWDRIEAGKPAFPPQAAWAAGPQSVVVLKKRPTVVFRITGRLDPKTCP